ncbi:hypothetical protein CEQ90_05825 [Lewinellaceae bacterium SD302]|nr:hypothetical protein CEQ90_05825 [Lewinellaceae bacterium SD302]
MRSNIILASMLALVSYWYSRTECLQEQRLAELNTLQEVLASDRQLIETENEYTLSQLLWELDVDHKTRYQPVLPMITETNEIAGKFLKQSDIYLKQHGKRKLTDDELQTLEILAERQLFGIESNFALSLKAMSREFGISEHQIKSMLDISDCAKSIQSFRSILQDRASGLDSVSTSVRLAILNQQFVQLTYEMTIFYAQLAGGKDLYCNFGLPFSVYAVEQTTRVGDPVHFLLVVPGYVPERDNIRFKINGKPFVPDMNGVIEYNGFYNAHQPIVEIDYKIVNPITGEVNEGEWTYNLLKG